MYSHSAASYERLLLYVVMYNNNVPLMCNVVGSCQVMMMGTPKYGCDHILTQWCSCDPDVLSVPVVFGV